MQSIRHWFKLASNRQAYPLYQTWGWNPLSSTLLLSLASFVFFSPVNNRSFFWLNLKMQTLSSVSVHLYVQKQSCFTISCVRKSCVHFHSYQTVWSTYFWVYQTSCKLFKSWNIWVNLLIAPYFVFTSQALCTLPEGTTQRVNWVIRDSYATTPTIWGLFFFF